MSRWVTTGGSVWWYTDFWSCGEASIDPFPPPGMFNIGSIAPVSGQLTEERLHELIWLTHQQFIGMRIRCSTTPAVRVLLEGLSAKGLAKWRSEDRRSNCLDLLSVRAPTPKAERRW